MFVNLTPHIISVVDVVAIAPSGVVARVTSTTKVVGVINNVTISRVEFGEVIGLPAPEDGKVFIVSMLVRTAVPSRTDVVSPGNLVRDSAGNPIGCDGFVCN